MKYKKIVLYLVIFLLIAVGCSKEEMTGPDNQEIIVPESTEIVSKEVANEQIEAIEEDGSFIVGENSTLADLEIGEILILDACDAAPDGLLRKIIGRVEENGSILFETEQASLAEAVQQLTLSESYQLTPENVRQVHLYNGSSYNPERDGFEFPIDIDCVLYDQDGNYFTTDDQIKLYGDLTFTAELFTEIEISEFALNKFEIGIESERDANLNLNASLFWEFNEELTFDIAEFNFTPITFMAGPVPIVITPVLNLEAHIHGDLTVTFTTGITYNESVRYGVGYENDEWYQIKESDKTFNYTPPQFTTEFNFETGASLKLSTLIYGVIGPYVRAKAGLHFQAALEVNPTETHLNYDLEAILYAICGIYFEVLDQTLLDEFIEFNIYTYPIGEWMISLDEMVFVQGGTFEMGDHFDEGWSQEFPVHSVTLDNFYISGYEVTQAEYEAIVGNNPASGYGVGDNYPVYNVSWFDAVTFCNLKSQQEGLTPCYDLNDWICDFSANGYRLPTEAEWEYAARGGINWEDNYRYSGCLDENDLMDYAWYFGNSSPNSSHEVGTKLPNQLARCYDMSGNLWEWCNDWYDSSYYLSSPTNNPTGPGSGSSRVLRSGSYPSDAFLCRVTFRDGIEPTYNHYILGFRICKSH